MKAPPMFKPILRFVLTVFGGVLLGQIPVGRTTVGRSAWQYTQQFLSWSGNQAHSLVKQAGLTDIRWDWVPGRESAKKTRDNRTDSVDKESMRKLLE